MDFLEKARELEAQLVAWRRDIHMHPELGFEETRTARLVADTLRELDMEVEVGVGITGVVGRLGQGRPVIGIRADMDALPIQEANEVPYKSQTPGVMHACGHDAHTAMLLGVARMLHEMPDRPPGEIRFLFQPSEEKWDEEIKSGATRMIDDRALEGVDAVIALHIASQLPSGVVEIGEGHMLAAVDTFRVTIKGQGCHGALPHTGIDPIYIQAQVVNAIHGIRARRLDPTQPAVVTIGTIHGGLADNVIPQEVHLTGTIRSFSEETRSQVHDELARALDVARALGGDYSPTIERGYPALYDDPAVAQTIEAAAADLISAESTRPGTPIMGAEDFAYMAQQAPGAMFMLGAQIGHDNRPHHSPIFDIDEGAMPVGAAVLAETAVRLLREYA
jgi:amidohydrolase